MITAGVLPPLLKLLKSQNKVKKFKTRTEKLKNNRTEKKGTGKRKRRKEITIVLPPLLKLLKSQNKVKMRKKKQRPDREERRV